MTRASRRNDSVWLMEIRIHIKIFLYLLLFKLLLTIHKAILLMKSNMIIVSGDAHVIGVVEPRARRIPTYQLALPPLFPLLHTDQRVVDAARFVANLSVASVGAGSVVTATGAAGEMTLLVAKVSLDGSRQSSACSSVPRS